MKRGTWAENADVALAAVGILWLVFLADKILPADLRGLGIRPRQASGALGILFCPFLHASFTHLAANSVALFVLLTLSLSLGRGITLEVVILTAGIGGFLVWLLGQSGTVYIGASGVIFGLIGFLLAFGLFRRAIRPALMSLMVFALYGGSLLTLFRNQPGVSWLAHAGGFIAGVMSAWWMRAAPAR